jgi:DNA-binding response OmpR family regulator
MGKILVVDDEEMSHRLIEGALEDLDQVELVFAFDGETALELARATPPDLVISDVSMPAMDGLSLCRQIRRDERLARIPVLLLTARGESLDKYDGFNHGADDYLIKPVDVRELELRVRALLRRRVAASRPAQLAVGQIVLEPGVYTCTIQGHAIRLTDSELAIMKYLLAHAGQVIKSERLLQEALGYPPGGGNPQAVHGHIRNVRAKIQAAGLAEQVLVSSWQGYMLRA